jgi:hypothetical protein
MTTAADPFAHFNYDFNDDTAGAANAAPAPWSPVGVLLDDFLTVTDAMHWSVDGLAVKGGIIVFAGRPESFKSAATQNLAMAYARLWDGEWMGLPVAEGPVLYGTNEKAAGSIRERFAKMLTTKVDDDGGEAPAYPVYIVHNKVRMGMPATDKTRDWADLKADVDALSDGGLHHPLVIIDTLASVAWPGFDENNGDHVGQVLDFLHSLRDRGCTILLVHHFSKQGHANGDDAMGLRGHTRLYGDIDGTVTFTRDGDAPTGTMYPRPKDGSPSRKTFVVNVESDFRLVEREGTIVLLTTDMVIDAVRNGAGTSDEVFATCKEQITGVTRGQVREKVKELLAAGLLVKTKGRNPRLTTHDDIGGSGGRQADADADVDTDDESQDA